MNPDIYDYLGIRRRGIKGVLILRLSVKGLTLNFECCRRQNQVRRVQYTGRK